MKRETVLRMLKNRLNESKENIKFHHKYNDLAGVLGGFQLPKQVTENAKTDIEQLEYLIWCLKNKEAVKEIFNTYGA